MLNALLDVADAQSVNAMVLSMGVVGGGASHTVINDALAALQDLCADGSCVPGAVDDLVAQSEGLTATQLQTAHQSGGRRFQTLSNASRSIKDADRNLLNVIR